MTITSYVDALRKINIRCSDFIELGTPLYRHVPWEVGGTFSRIKVRFRKPPSFSELLDRTVGSPISERFIEARTVTSESAHPMYYMFPVNGFKVAWTPSQGSLLEAVKNDMSVPVRLDHLDVAASIRRDVVLFNIADYYIIHEGAVKSYATLLEAITSSTFEPTLLQNS